jgi:pyruvate dehydrogenase E2 component (dihydrolipoamide acetyltransferase)
MPDILMPAIGDLADAVLIQWRVAPGDRVQRMQSVAYVETDKGVIEVESFVEGVVERLLVAPGDRVAVHQCIATVTPG